MTGHSHTKLCQIKAEIVAGTYLTAHGVRVVVDRLFDVLSPSSQRRLTSTPAAPDDDGAVGSTERKAGND